MASLANGGDNRCRRNWSNVRNREYTFAGFMLGCAFIPVPWLDISATFQVFGEIRSEDFCWATVST
jgi:hypothetical protein